MSQFVGDEIEGLMLKSVSDRRNSIYLVIDQKLVDPLKLLGFPGTGVVFRDRRIPLLLL